MNQLINKYSDDLLIYSYRRVKTELDRGTKIIKQYSVDLEPEIHYKERNLTKKEIKELKIILQRYDEEIFKRGISGSK